MSVNHPSTCFLCQIHHRLPLVEPPPVPNPRATHNAGSTMELATLIEHRHEQVEISENSLTSALCTSNRKPYERVLSQAV